MFSNVRNRVALTWQVRISNPAVWFGLVLILLSLPSCSQLIPDAQTESLEMTPSTEAEASGEIAPTQLPATGLATENPTAEPPRPTAPLLTPTPVQPGLEVLAQTGGSLNSLVVQDDRAYLGIGPRLVVLDIQNPEMSSELGHSDPLPGVAVSIDIEEGRAYLLTKEAGLLALDLSDPTQMRIVADLPLEYEPAHLMFQGNLGAIVENICQNSACTGWLRVVDLSNPDQLQVIGSLELPDRAFQVYLQDDIAYIAHMSGLEAVSLTEPTNPTRLGSYEASYLIGATFAPPVAYLTGAGVEIVDLSNPAELHRIGFWEPGTEGFNLHLLASSDSRLYVFNSFGEFGFCESTLFVVDITDPAMPAFLGESRPLECAGQVQADGNRLYATDWQGFHILDLTDPTQPLNLGSYTTLKETPSLAVSPEGYIYWGDALAEKSLHVTDARQLDHFEHYGPFPPGWYTSGLVFGHYLYAPVWQNGFNVLDIRNPVEPRQVTNLGVEEIPSSILELSQEGSYLFAALEASGLLVLDVSDPEKPQPVASYPAEAGVVSAEDITVSQGFAYLTEVFYGQETVETRLEVIDVSNPGNPQLKGSLGFGQSYSYARVDIQGKIALMSAQLCSETICDGWLYTIDISDPANPRRIGELNGLGNVQDVTSARNYALLPAGSQGVWIVDVSDAASPRLAGQFKAPGFARRLIAAADRFYLAANQAGIYILKLITP